MISYRSLLNSTTVLFDIYIYAYIYIYIYIYIYMYIYIYNIYICVCVCVCIYTCISRLTVVSHEAKEEVPCNSLLMNAHEYFTRKNLVKIKNTITDEPKTLGLYFLVGGSYKPKLKPAGPRIALYQHLTDFLYTCECVTHESSLTF